jgi:hypothetical protein
MNKNQKGFGHIGLGLLMVAVALVCWITFLAANNSRHSKQAKDDLDRNFASLKSPTGCTEDKRYYVKPGIDTRSSWRVYYSCSSEINAIYDELKTDAKSSGYTAERDSPNYDRSHLLQSVNLTLLKNGYVARYYLEDYNNPKRMLDLEFQKN